GSWTGNVIYADDDAPDECFRAYESVLESYQDHSDFLRKNWRYHPLFELESTNYKGWCHGLRKAGYATNPQYGKILISLIERYELYKYDVASLPGTGLPTLIPGQAINGVPVKTVQEGETVQSIASSNYVKDRHIRKWNDLPSGSEVKSGDIIYLKPKRRRGSVEKHTISEGETMHVISQKYGIKLKQLYKKNRMEFGTEPQKGEVLYMQRKRSSDDKVKTATPKPKWEEPKEEFVNPHDKKIDTKSIDFKNPGVLNKENVVVPEFHIVAKGDNIYRIAEKYHVFEEDLLKWNTHLDPSAMSIGQKIYLTLEAAEKNNANTPREPKEVEIETPKTEKEIEEIKEEIVVNGPVNHVVVKGDTLYNICKRYNVTEDQLKEWNNLETITIKIGQKLQVSE
ncbi:MAG: LysM peptidoglycan-binding domain-containing protein, partial [Bacteroidia bacterium]|nr:LysM peptidoglycan-binding domain-containing protein [Bacteroidia bacterium]